MDEQKLRGYVRLVLERSMISPSDEKQLLQAIDDGPYHSMPVDQLGPDELEAAEALATKGLLRRMPADRRMPERFVLTGGGSHKTGTFAMDEPLPRRRIASRPATKKWW